MQLNPTIKSTKRKESSFDLDITPGLVARTAGRTVGIVAIAALGLLAFTVVIATSGLGLAIFAASAAMLFNAYALCEGTASAFDFLFAQKTSEGLFKDLEDSPVKKGIIIASSLLFILSSLALGALIYASAAITLAFPPLLAAMFAVAIVISIASTMTAAFAKIIQTPWKVIKRKTKKYANDLLKRRKSEGESKTQHAIRFAVTLTFILGGVCLAVFTAILPLTLFHQTSLNLLPALPANTVLAADIVSGIIIYGIAGCVRMFFSLMSCVHYMTERSRSLVRFIKNPKESWEKLKKTYHDKPILSFLKWLGSETLTFIIATFNVLSGALFFAPGQTGLVSVVSGPIIGDNAGGVLKDLKHRTLSKSNTGYSSLEPDNAEERATKLQTFSFTSPKHTPSKSSLTDTDEQVPLLVDPSLLDSTPHTLYHDAFTLSSPPILAN